MGLKTADEVADNNDKVARLVAEKLKEGLK
jgi:hypothetical protein